MRREGWGNDIRSDQSRGKAGAGAEAGRHLRRKAWRRHTAKEARAVAGGE